MKAYGPVNRTWSPERFSLNQILHKLNTTQNMHTLQAKHNLKVSPFGIALIKILQIKLGDAGTIDRFGLAFLYLFLNYKKKNGHTQSQIKNTI